MVGDSDRGAGRRAAERSRLVVVANDTVAPRPVCILSDRVRADGQTGDGLAFVVLEHDGGHDLTGAVLDIEHERLVRVRAIAGDGLGDRQAAGVDMAQERCAVRQGAGLALAGCVLECGIRRHIGLTDLHSRSHTEVRPGVDLAVHDSIGVRRVGKRQLRGCAHRIGVGLGFAVLPHGGGQVAVKAGRGVAVIALAVLEGQLRLENVDAGGAVARLLRCGVGRSACRLRRDRDRDRIGNVIFQVRQVSNHVAVFIHDRDGDVHVFRLPSFKAVIVCVQVERNATDRGRCTGFQLVGSHAAEQIHILLRRRHRHRLDRHIDLRAFKGRNRKLRCAVCVDSSVGIREHIVAAEETVLWHDLKGDDQFMAARDSRAIRLCFHAAPIVGEVKAGHADLSIRQDAGSCAHIPIAGCAPLIRVSGLSGAGIGLQPDLLRRCTGREAELLRDDILDDRLAAKRGA